MEWRKVLLINKQKGHCLRISTQVGRRPEETQGGVSVNVCVFLVKWGGGDAMRM